MSSVKILSVCVALIWASVTTLAETQKVASFGEIARLDDKLIFATCYDYNNNNKTFGCTVHSRTSTTEENTKIFHSVKEKDQTCNVSYSAENGKVFGRGLDVKPLYHGRVLFSWLVHDEADNLKDPYAVLRVINMKDCKFEETKIPYGQITNLHRNFENYHAVVYNDTFDVFFPNKRLCGDMMCVQTHDVDGKIISGSKTSYLPVEFFAHSTTSLCPAKSGSSTSGHFLITSSKVRLISSQNGEIKDLMDYPSSDVDPIYSCDKGFAGVCWEEYYFNNATQQFESMQVQCKQFDSQGKLIVDKKVEQGFIRRRWITMQNLPDGGLLLQTTLRDKNIPCSDDKCLSYFVQKIHENGEVDNLGEIKDIPCLTLAVSSDIEMPDGNVCVRFLCRDEKNIYDYPIVWSGMHVKCMFDQKSDIINQH